MHFRLLYTAREHLNIKSHTPGTLKLGVKSSIMGVPGISNLSTSDLPPGVHKVDVSIFSMSATVSYDPDAIDPQVVQELLTTAEGDRSEELLTILAGAEA